MDTKNIFTDEFVKLVESILNEKCQPGIIFTRKDVCKELGLGDEHANVISLLMNGGYIEGYDISRGRYGGIYRITDRTDKKSNATINISDEFKTHLRGILVEHCSVDMKLSRKEVAELMDSPGIATENKISAALKLPDFSDYKITRGQGIGPEVIILEDLNLGDAKTMPELLSALANSNDSVLSGQENALTIGND